eukprot:2242766-Lingulodinium_polyedra.AAC.1
MPFQAWQDELNAQQAAIQRATIQHAAIQAAVQQAVERGAPQQQSQPSVTVTASPVTPDAPAE